MARKMFSPCNNPRISRLAFEDALQQYPYAPKPGDTATHSSGLKVEILQRGYNYTLCRTPRGRQITFLNSFLKGDTVA